MLEWWPAGIVQGPDGIARELPQRHGWASCIFVTQDGVARRRFWNPIARRWHWDARPLPLIVSDDRIGIHAPQFMTLERAICMAWRRRAVDGAPGIGEVGRVDLVDCNADSVSSDDGVSAASLRWDDEEEGEPGVVEGERWRPLKGHIGAVPIPKGFAISTHGRLRDPRGRMTIGLWALGRRWAAVAGAGGYVGMLDLFEAAGLDGGVSLPLSIRRARGALLAGASPADLARHAEISESTAWSYFAQAAVHVDGATLRTRVKPLVSPTLWRALVALRGDTRLGGSLNELDGLLGRSLPVKQRQSAHWVSQVRLARTALTAP